MDLTIDDDEKAAAEEKKVEEEKAKKKEEDMLFMEIAQPPPSPMEEKNPQPSGDPLLDLFAPPPKSANRPKPQVIPENGSGAIDDLFSPKSSGRPSQQPKAPANPFDDAVPPKPADGENPFDMFFDQLSGDPQNQGANAAAAGQKKKLSALGQSNSARNL